MFLFLSIFCAQTAPDLTSVSDMIIVRQNQTKYVVVACVKTATLLSIPFGL